MENPPAIELVKCLEGRTHVFRATPPLRVTAQHGARRAVDALVVTAHEDFEQVGLSARTLRTDSSSEKSFAPAV